ncbi:MAG TPA: TonB-dependent receptor [Chitinophagaceae bacterium]|nr:TonB-dependent receptor [Chitinophagaceae bacterium]
MRKKITLVAAVLFMLTLHAQEDTATKSLNEVTVTANRFPQKQLQTGKVVTIISQEVLSRSVGKTLPDLLNQQAGITIVGSQNNLGSNQDVYVRGAGTGRTLILVDGVPAYDPSTISAAFDINHFPIDNIERIEIVRGALSTLYGSDAVAGVINIITKKEGKKPASVYGTMAGGTFGTYKAAAGINGLLNKSSYNVQYTRLQSNGFSAAHDSTGRNNFDKDEFVQNNFAASFRTNISNELQFRINAAAGMYSTGLDAAAFRDESDYTFSSNNLQAGAGLEYRYNRGTIHFNYNVNNTKRNYLNDSLQVADLAKFTRQEYMGRSQVAEVYTTWRMHKLLHFLIGADHRIQNTDQEFFSISSFGPYQSKRGSDSSKMNQQSVFASAFINNAKGFNIEVGGRYNHHSEYGSNATYTINPSYLINNRWKLFANMATAFKAPSLYQLFVVNNGKKPLEPETSRTMDGGIEYNNPDKKLKGRAVYFTSEVEKGIDYSFVTFDYFNNNLQNDRGVEIEAEMKLKMFSLVANYTYVTGKVTTKRYKYDPANWSYTETGDTTYNNLFRRPKNSVNLTLAFTPSDRLHLSTHARFAGKRFEQVFMNRPLELGAYQTIDVYVEYKVMKWLRAFVDLKNITNEQFFDVLGYNSRRFNFLAGVNVSF